MKAFFDTNVVVFAYDRGAGWKRERAQALIEAHVRSASLVLSTQVLIEAYNTLLRAQILRPDAALGVIETLAEEREVPIDATLVLRAIRLGQQHRLSHWDSLIVQAAVDAGCGVLYSEDLHTGMRFGELEVVNPFMDTAHEAAPTSGPRPGARRRR